MGRGVVILALGTTGEMVVEDFTVGATMTSHVGIEEEEWAAVIGTIRTEVAPRVVDHLVLAATVDMIRAAAMVPVLGEIVGRTAVVMAGNLVVPMAADPVDQVAATE